MKGSRLTGALARVAADPARWDALVPVLTPDSPVPSGPALASLAEAAAQRAWRPGEGQQADASALFGRVTLSMSGRLLNWNSAGAAALADLCQGRPGEDVHWLCGENVQVICDGVRKASFGRCDVVIRLRRPGGAAPHLALLSVAAAIGRTPALATSEAISLTFPVLERSAAMTDRLNIDFQLTVAEARLAVALYQGQTLQQAARAFEVSLNTVRNQLRNVFEKLSVKRQADLTRVLGELDHLTRVAAIAGAHRQDPTDTPELRHVQLPDGRALAYREYGDPLGRSVVILHEGLGSSLLPPGTEARAAQLGLRLLAPERPGFGRSDPRAGYSFESVTEDLLHFCDDVGVGETVVGGLMSGAAFALHLGERLGRRARLILLCSGRAPVSAAAARDPFNALRQGLLHHAPVAEALYAVVRTRRSLPLTRRLLRYASANSPGDRDYEAQNSWLAEYVCAYVGEALARTTRGPVDDLLAFRRAQSRPSPSPSAPVELWHGSEDRLTSLDSMALYASSAVIERRVFPGVGYFLAAKHWGEILERASAI